MGNNFYETLDELFDNFMNTHNLHYNEDVLNIKSQIIQAYDFENLHKGDNIANILKPKNFRITEDGRIVLV